VSGDDRIALWAQLACIWEATARKAGNVHRFRDAGDMTYADFLLAAAAIAPIIGRAESQGIGKSVLEAVRATRAVVRVNVNLGIVMLLAPLAAVPAYEPLAAGLEKVLCELDLSDSQEVFEAIRLANPGGLGKVNCEDVREAPTLPLRRIMALAAERDLIARQYASAFQEVLEVGVPALQQGVERLGSLEAAIVHCQLTLLSRYQDSLIVRKAGEKVAEEASQRAGRVLAASWPDTVDSRNGFRVLDEWLRADGNRRNPGTTADLVAASLFVALREGILKVPLGIPWSADGRHE
jgi:triphosphoribosyl-dephospho-CoA synthase